LLKQLESVTSEDVLRVYNKYHVQFLEPSKRATVITTNPSTEAEVKKAFGKQKIVLEEPPFK
jgi:Zn-dependent M16 (insulinase) family peptidase